MKNQGFQLETFKLNSGLQVMQTSMKKPTPRPREAKTCTGSRTGVVKPDEIFQGLSQMDFDHILSFHKQQGFF